ncbi:AIPR family protein [Candidatus Parcubacteria bacterium]|nr:AIPR family protein [Candidatus Parcubacteria bacterium]
MKNSTPQKSAINSKIEDLIQDKYTYLNERLRRGMAFVDLATSIICDYATQSEDITDGNDDKGIDSIFIVSNEQGKFINIFNCKSSESDDFSEKDLSDFKEGLQYLFEKNKEEYIELENKNLLTKIENIREDKESIQEVNCFYCVFQGDDKTDKKIVRKIKEVENYFVAYFKSIYPYSQFSLKLISSEDLYSIDIKRKQNLKDETIELAYFGDKTISSEIEIEKIKGRLATARGQDIANLVKKYGDALFEKNVRGWMSFRKYNKDILESCSSEDDSELFWFLNNGLTIVCESCIPDPDKKMLKIKNLQIINGQQTSIVLEKASNNNKLKRATKILLKIYETTDSEIIIKVAKATNSQLVVKSRDLVSNNSEQIALQNEFLRKSYFYERQRGEKKPSKKKNVKIFFNNFFVAQSVLATVIAKPSLAKKKQEDKIFGEPIYSKIFKKRSSIEILAATLLCDFCFKKGTKIERKNEIDEIKYFAYFHIARIIWFYVKSEKNALDNKEIIKSIENNETKIIEVMYKKSVIVLKKIFDEYNKKEKIFSIGHLFSRLDIENDINKKINP